MRLAPLRRRAQFARVQILDHPPAQRAGLDDAALAKLTQRSSGRAAGDYPMMAPCGFSPVLAMEVSKEGRAAEDQSWSA